MSSIFVRITGIACFGFAVLVVLWLLSAAASESAFNVVDWMMTSFIGDILMLLAAWCIWFHVLGRLRHVIWDFGYCLDVPTSEKMGMGMFVGATVLALFTALVV